MGNLSYFKNFPIVIYDESRFEDANGFYHTRENLKEIVCTLSAIPGVSRNRSISFVDQINSQQWEFYQRSLRFSFSLDSHDGGQIGSEFIHSSLERCRYWAIETYRDNFGPNGCLWDVELICQDVHEESVRDFIVAVNTEINTNPKWAEHYDKFKLVFSGEFIKVK